MSTIRLFEQNAYIKEFPAKVLNLRTEEGKQLIQLDQTGFFPTGGGQGCDLGFINDCPVLEVFEMDGVIYHAVLNFGNLVPGDSIIGTIDWPRRFKNMQRHCGEHILSGIFFREFGGVNRGFHMGEDYMTIDISLEGIPVVESITWEMAMKAEQLANQAIWENLPVSTRHFENRKQAELLPLRKPLALDENITIVCVGSIENPSDCVACCGTHPKSAGEVGLIKILKIENHKGMFRVYFKAGEEALTDYRDKHDILTKLNNKYSSNTFDLLEKMQVQEEKVKAIKTQLHQIKQVVMREAQKELEQRLHSSENILVKQFEALGLEDLLQLGRSVTPSIPKLLLIVCPEESTVLLFSNGKSADCGKLVKETASIYNGKGGGNNTQARAIFPKAENIPTYVDLLEKHLR